MKKKFRFMMLLATLPLLGVVQAETSGNTPVLSPTDILLKKLKLPKNPNDPNRPRVPEMDRYMSVHLNGLLLTLDLPADIESAIVTISTGDFTVFAASVDRACPSVELPPLSGDFILTVTLDNGDVYEGVISL